MMFRQKCDVTHSGASDCAGAPGNTLAGRTRLAAEVGELEGNAEVAGAEFAHDLLKGVLVFGDDADGVALNRGLGFELGLFDEGNDFPGGVGVDALLELDLLADGGVCGGLDLFVLEILEGDASLDHALGENLCDGLQGVFVRAGELDGLVAFELDCGLGVLEIEAGVDFFGSLIDRVLYFLDIYFADYVEAVVGGHVLQGTRY